MIFELMVVMPFELNGFIALAFLLSFLLFGNSFYFSAQHIHWKKWTTKHCLCERVLIIMLAMMLRLLRYDSGNLL